MAESKNIDAKLIVSKARKAFVRQLTPHQYRLYIYAWSLLTINTNLETTMEKVIEGDKTPDIYPSCPSCNIQSFTFD